MLNKLVSIFPTSKWQFALGLLLLGLSAQTSASDFQSPRTASLGGAGRAAPLLNDSVYLNPSFASFLKSYSISYSFSSFDSNPENVYHGRMFNLGLQDGRNEFFQAGVGYTVRETGKHLNFGASKSFLQRYSAGLGAKFFFDSKNGKPAARDMILGFSGVVEQWFQVALVIDNLLQGDAAKERGLYREIALGTKVIIIELIMLYLDPHITPDLPSDDQFGYEMGLEYAIMNDLFFRMGLFNNSNVPVQSVRGGGFALGAGWVGPRFSLDYAFKKVTRYSSEYTGLPAATTHHFGMTLYF